MEEEAIKKMLSAAAKSQLTNIFVNIIEEYSCKSLFSRFVPFLRC
jgi:hypothetical protein